MSYLIAFGVGIVLGIIVTVILLSPKALEQYHHISDSASKSFQNAKRARKLYMESFDEEDDEEE